VADSTLVGRTAEFARLGGYLSRAGSGGGLVVVAGEAGIGKTRLVDELATGAAASHGVVRGRADEHETVAFGLWLGPLRQLDLPHPGTDASIAASELRWDVVDLLVSGLRSSGPALVVLDDLHWADDDSLWILEHVTDRVVDADVTIVATTRPSAEARAARWHNVYRRAEVVALDGLDVAEVQELSSRMGATASDAEALWRRTGGNPLFIREVVAAGAGNAAMSGDLLAASIDRAGPDVARVVSLLAIAGPDTPREILASAVEVEPDDLDVHLDAARRADLVRDDSGVLRLRHDLIADAAARRLSPAERRRLHVALGDAWAARPGPTALAAVARHRVSSIGPATSDDQRATAAAAADTVLEAAGSLVTSGRAADATRVLRQARIALEPRADVTTDLKARLALAEFESRWAVDDIEGAMAMAEAGVTLAAATDDPVLQATAALAAVSHHNPMAPHPALAARVAEADEHLPASHDAIDPTLRIRLRSRRSVLMLSLPEQQQEALVVGDDAVARARELADPAVHVQAISDRYFALPRPEDFDARDRGAEEILDIARVTGRTEFARRGQEWRFAAKLSSGDLDGAVAALTELEALASILPSPYWRWAAALRRSSLLALLGDRQGAIDLLVSARQVAAGAAPDAEIHGLECGCRLSIATLYGRTDGGADMLHRDNVAAMGDVPVLFLQSRFALSEATFDDAAAARRRLQPWRGRFDAALYEIEGLSSVSAMATTAVMIGWTEVAAELRAIMRPFAGRLVGGNGLLIDVPVDHQLAALALLEDDLDEAARRAHAAVAFARRLRLPTIEARTLSLLADVSERRGDAAAAASARDAASVIAEPLGMLLHPTGGAPQAAPVRRVPQVEREASARLDGGRWFIDSPYGTGHVADSTGMGQLVQLLAAPGREVASVDLAGAATGGEVVVNSDLGPQLDARAKREYRRRIAELQSEIDEAEAHHDPERAEKHRVELDALLGELRSAVGLGGRDRPQGSGNERARINVARNVRRAIAAIRGAVPDLGAHLEVSVRTGHQCSYAPEPAALLIWHIDR
jgi:hypothetical protein